MRIIETEDYQEMSQVLLQIFEKQIQDKPDSVLSFTTGKTPEAFLCRLADAVNDGLDISSSVFLNLDEYVGKRDMPYSVYSFMKTCLYDRIQMKPRVVEMMNAEAQNQEEELKRYSEVLKKYPRDIQLLGLGTNGHIGANEPGTPFDSTLFVADSFDSTIEATQKLFHLNKEETPTQMFTMGFQEIMAAGHVILAAAGKSKAKAVKALVEGEITTDVPASILRTHENCTLIIDKEAASLLQQERWNFLSTWKMSEGGIEDAIKAFMETKDIHCAITKGVKAVEDREEYHSVGYGGLPNIYGDVELDAAYMNGDTLKAGGIMAVRNVKNPIEVAKKLSTYDRNNFLAGEGAMKFAASKGFAFSNMLSDTAKNRFGEAMKEKGGFTAQEAYDGHDTVCMIGRDPKGSMGCGVSTSGLFLKHPGRVGDSPVIGSGFYADSQIGAAAATGVGEDIMRGCLSFAIVEKMAEGYSAQKACEVVLKRHLERLRKKDGKCGSMSVIAMDRNGAVGAATSLTAFPFVVGNTKGDIKVLVVHPEDEGMYLFEPDEQWWKKYQGD